VDHPERLIALGLSTLVLIVELAGLRSVHRVRRLLRGLHGESLATIILGLGCAITLAQVIVVLNTGIIVADGDPNIRTLLLIAFQFILLGGLLWSVRKAEKLIR
jgi:hypothetical protein